MSSPKLWKDWESDMYQHIPVMLKEVIRLANLSTGKIVIDCTLGGGSYTMAAAQSVGKTGRVLSIDLDELALSNARRLMGELKIKNIILKQGNFREIIEFFRGEFGPEAKADAILFDLGLSSAQLDDPARGFSFQGDGPLDMSFARNGQTTKSIVNKWPEKELARIIREYGEENYAGRIAKGIAEYRRLHRIETSGQLLAIIERAVPARYKHDSHIHFATRTFQALRIATNQELESLQEALAGATDLLAPGGRIVAVSFHSLEDRIVKQYFRQEAKDCLCPPRQPICTCGHRATLSIITKKPLLPDPEEIQSNYRSRSAKLRVAEKI